MKKILLMALILVLSFSLIACAITNVGKEQQQTGEPDEKAIVSIVEGFGKKLQAVSLQAPMDILEKSMKENYGEFVTRELIVKWISDPLNAPGRLTSSPWPDRIEILETKKLSDDSYQVEGKIIEIANAENSSTKIVAKRPVILVLKKVDKSWLIHEVTLGAYEDPKPETLTLKDYFPISMGSTWRYLGEGNEYASFERRILFREENRAQSTEDNGGTVSSSVFEVSEKEILRTFFQGEEYSQENLMDKKSNDDLVVLKAPLKAGTKWKTSKDVREIVGIDATVDTPAGKFENCIKVSIKSDNSTMYEYFKAGIGMVKREFISEGITITSTLEKYEIK